jgi:hypothetical protein
LVRHLEMFSTITLHPVEKISGCCYQITRFFLCFRGKQFSLPDDMDELGQQYTVVFAINVTEPASECVCLQVP